MSLAPPVRPPPAGGDAEIEVRMKMWIRFYLMFLHFGSYWHHFGILSLAPPISPPADGGAEMEVRMQIRIFVYMPFFHFGSFGIMSVASPISLSCGRVCRHQRLNANFDNLLFLNLSSFGYIFSIILAGGGMVGGREGGWPSHGALHRPTHAPSIHKTYPKHTQLTSQTCSKHL